MRLLVLLFCLVAGNVFGQCQKMDIMVLADLSGSVSGYEGYIADAIDALVDNTVLGETRIGIIAYSDDPVTITDFTASAKILSQGSNQIKYNWRARFGGTNLTGAFVQTKILFEEYGREDAVKIIIVISDGLPNQVGIAMQSAEFLKGTGALICTVLVGAKVKDEQFMQAISSGCYVSTNFQGLAEEIKKLNYCF